MALYPVFERGLKMDDEDIEMGIVGPLEKSFKNSPSSEKHNSRVPKEATTFETVMVALEEFVIPVFVLLVIDLLTVAARTDSLNYVNENILIVQYWASILHIVCVCCYGVFCDVGPKEAFLTRSNSRKDLSSMEVNSWLVVVRVVHVVHVVLFMCIVQLRLVDSIFLENVMYFLIVELLIILKYVLFTWTRVLGKILSFSQKPYWTEEKLRLATSRTLILAELSCVFMLSVIYYDVYHRPLSNYHFLLTCVGISLCGFFRHLREP
jgi:hypothetical protein